MFCRRLVCIFSLRFLLSCNSQAILSVQINTRLADTWETPGSERWDGSSPPQTPLPTHLNHSGVKREPRGAKSCFLGALGHLRVTPQTISLAALKNFLGLTLTDAFLIFFFLQLYSYLPKQMCMECALQPSINRTVILCCASIRRELGHCPFYSSAKALRSSPLSSEGKLLLLIDVIRG